MLTSQVEEIDEGISKMMKYGTAEVFKGTIYPSDDFSAESAAETLENAMSGLGKIVLFCQKDGVYVII